MADASIESDIHTAADGMKSKRMSFIFPSVFKDMLYSLKRKYNKDMTYIVMEAVNEWVMRKENISTELINNGGLKNKKEVGLFNGKPD